MARRRERETGASPNGESADSVKSAEGTSRRQRRREDAARQRAELRDRRRSEPASPAGVIAVIILLAIIVLGVGGGLPRLFGRDSGEGPVGLLSPSAPQLSEPGSAQPSASEPPGASSEPLSTPPPQTQRPGAEATAAADSTARSWANLFYKRTPATESYEQLVDRATQFTTPELADSFSSAGDATYDALRTAGGSSKVLSVTTVTPRPDTAPTDTPTRITRLVTVKVQTTGKGAGTFDVPLLVTVVRDGQPWLVSAVDGGTGP